MYFYSYSYLSQSLLQDLSTKFTNHNVDCSHYSNQFRSAILQNWRGLSLVTVFQETWQPFSRSSWILLITRMITDRIGLTIINDRILTTLTRDIEYKWIHEISYIWTVEKDMKTRLHDHRSYTLNLKQLWIFFRLQVWRISSPHIQHNGTSWCSNWWQIDFRKPHRQNM